MTEEDNPRANENITGDEGADPEIKDYLAGEGEYADDAAETPAPNSSMVGKQTLTHADQKPNAGDLDKAPDEAAANEGEVIINPVDAREDLEAEREETDET